MPNICYAFDFDFTLSHFPNGIQSLLSIAYGTGIPRETVDRIYNEVVDSSEGFSHITFSTALAHADPTIDAKKLADEICAWLAADSIAPYTESRETFDRFLTQGFATAIITAGNPEWQNKKLEMLAFPQPAERIFITSPTEGKAPAIKKLFDQGFDFIHYTDDRPGELDRIRDVYGPDRVATYWIVRDDSPYKSAGARHQHKIITSLTEV